MEAPAPASHDAPVRGFWRRVQARGVQAVRCELAPAAAAGLVAAQVHVMVAPELGVTGAAAAAMKWMPAAWAVASALMVAGKVIEGTGTARPAPPRISPAQALLAAGTLIVAALLRSPARLVVNLAGFALVALPLLWLVQRRSDAANATRAVAVLAVFAFFPTHLNAPAVPAVEPARTGSAHRWTVGWPIEGWLLRHEMQVPEPFGNQRGVIYVELAGEYRGPARIHATVNGVEIGPLRHDERQRLSGDVPADALRGHNRVVVELRQSLADPTLRIVAQRWSRGASAGASASSFHDTEVWRAGTFDDHAGRQAPGIYLIQLQLR